MNLQMNNESIDDDDEFGDFEGRPVLVWFVMAVALVAIAFLLGSAPEAVARPVAGAAVTLNAVAAQPVALDSASAFGG